jgi:cytoskeletal protein CcmA (bactofilin family)
MNAAFLLPWALLAAVAALLFVLPFLPCWREWRHPTDCAPLAIVRGEVNGVHYFAEAFRMRGGEPGPEPAGRLVEGDAVFGPDAGVGGWVHADGTLSLGPRAVVPERVTAGKELMLGKGTGFCRMHAPVIRFGSGKDRAAQPQPRPLPRMRRLALARPGQLLRPRGAGCYRAEGDVRLPLRHYLDGALIATGGLRLDDGAAIYGAVKARRNVRLGRGVQIHGALVCEGDIDIGPDCWIKGPIVCESDVRVGRGTRFGTRTAPTTVIAARVLAEPGVTAHGTVWARDAGVVAA